MIGIIGTVEGIFRNKHTGKVTRKFPLCTNHIQDFYLNTFRQDANTTLATKLSDELFVSDYNPGRQRRDLPSTFYATARQGVDIDGVTPKVLIRDDSPGIHLLRITQRLDPPAEDFTINSVGLCSSVGNNGTRINGLSNFVWLETPCVQTTDEVLDLYYRVQFLYETDYLNNEENSRSLLPSEAYYYAQGLAGYASSHIIQGSYSKKYLWRSEQSLVNSRVLDDKLHISGNNLEYCGLYWKGTHAVKSFKASSVTAD